MTRLASALAARPERLAFGLVLFGLAAAYGPHLRNGFVWDDHPMIETSPYVRGEVPWGQAFLEDEWAHMRGEIGAGYLYYRPLFNVLNRATYLLFGARPVAFHARSLALHGVAVLLAWHVLTVVGLSRARAAASAVVFALHPLAAEVNFWISVASDQLLLVALLGALALDVRAESRSGLPRWAFVVLSTAATVLGLLAKESAVVIAPIVTLHALLTAPAGTGGRRSRTLLPHWAVTIAYLGLRSAVVGDAGTGNLRWDGLETFARIGLALRADLRLLLVPFPLTPFHPGPPQHPGPLPAATGLAVLAGLALLALWLTRWWRAAAFWLAWIVLPLLPRLVQLLAERRSPMIVAERYLYQSLVPWCVVCVAAGAYLLDRLSPRNGRVAGAILVAGTCGLGGLVTYQHGFAFSGDEAFFAHAARHTPDEGVVLNYQAQQAMNRGNHREALELLRRGMADSPGLAPLHANAGICLIALGRPAEAVPAFEEALRQDPRIVGVRVYLGDALRALGRIDEAGAQYAAELERTPTSVAAAMNLGTYRYVKGETRQAIQIWEELLRRHPDHPEALFNLGMACRNLPDAGRSAAYLRRFVEVAGSEFAEQKRLAREWLVSENVDRPRS